eukprot:1324971-Alexandrium_andersonii.AAC.1
MALEGLGHYTWDRLATLLTDKSGNWVQDRCLQCYHVSQSFIYKKVLTTAKAYPWKLLQGDRAENLRLATEEGLVDEVTTK